MKQLLFFTLLVLIAFGLVAQNDSSFAAYSTHLNPFEKVGIDEKVLVIRGYDFMDENPRYVTYFGWVYDRETKKIIAKAEEPEDTAQQVFDKEKNYRWLSMDPVIHAYQSPFSALDNSPIIYVDPDGMDVIGSDGQAVTYTRIESGSIEWSKNATADIIEVGTAMLSTDFGEASFNKWQEAETEVYVAIDRTTPYDGGDYAETKARPNSEGDNYTDDGQYTVIDVIFYDNNIEAYRAIGSGERYEGASREETLGAVGTHEVYHNEAKQIDRDIRRLELRQKPKKNLPINAEVNFREEYHKKNPGLPNANTWRTKYKEKGYEGIPKN